MKTATIPAELEAYWKQLDCGFPRVEPMFAECMREALTTLSKQGADAYIEHARFLGKMGRGAEPILIFLDIVLDFMERTTGSIHGIHQTFPSPGLPEFFKQIPLLLGQLSLAGLKDWVEYGVRYYKDHPDRQIDYFSLQSADSRAVLQRERHGTLLVDNERKLDMYLRGLWHDEGQLIPYSSAFDELRQPVPYYDKLGIRLPDVYDDDRGVSGLNRYRATLAHIAGH